MLDEMGKCFVILKIINGKKGYHVIKISAQNMQSQNQKGCVEHFKATNKTSVRRKD